MGTYKLNQLRKKLGENEIKPKDEASLRNIEMQLVNNYINGYTEKLSLHKDVDDGGNPKKVQLDKDHFENFVNLT